MSYEEILNKFVEKEQEIIKLKDEVYRLRAELDWLKRQNEIKGQVMATKKELIKMLDDNFNDDDVIVIMDSAGGWDNIDFVGIKDGMRVITFGGGSPFSDE